MATWCRGVIRSDPRSSSASGCAAIYVRGIVEPPSVDHDLAILLTKGRQRDVALLESRAAAWFEPVPAHDFVAALLATVAQWHAEPEWRGDEYDVVLALARIQ